MDTPEREDGCLLSPELEREIAKLMQALTLRTLRGIDQGDEKIARLQTALKDLRASHAAELEEISTELKKLDSSLGAAEQAIKRLV